MQKLFLYSCKYLENKETHIEYSKVIEYSNIEEFSILTINSNQCVEQVTVFTFLDRSKSIGRYSFQYQISSI